MWTRLFQTRNNVHDVRNRLDWDISFVYQHSLPRPSPYGRLSYVVFVVGTNEDCILQIRGVFYCLFGGVGEGGLVGANKWNVQFYFQPPTFYFSPPPLKFLELGLKALVLLYKRLLSGDLVVLFSICTNSFPLGARDLLLAVYSYDLFFNLISSLYSPLCPEERRPLYRLFRGHFLLREAHQHRCFSNF